MYFNQLLPLFVQKGNDGNYVPTAACDLHCLQVTMPAKSLVCFNMKSVHCLPAVMTPCHHSLHTHFTFSIASATIKWYYLESES